MIKRIVKIVFYPIGILLLAFFTWVGFQVALCPIYSFPEPQPFSGSHWYNPYADLSGNWTKANFHAHCRAWAGTTDGKDSIEDLYARYSEMGYDIISVSNYQSILQHDSLPVNVIPVYEHGYSTRKVHQLAIGASKVIWADYAFRQTVHNRQHIIKTLKHHADFIALAHPRMMNGYRHFDLKLLTDYDFFEVLNHYRTSSARWDTALSAGKVSWILGNDDTHNVNKPRETGVRWTMINAESPKKEDIYKALRTGRTMGVKGQGGMNDNALESVQIRNDSLFLSLQNPAKEIVFIGQNGEERATVRETSAASLALMPDDTYIRTEIQNGDTRIYLNPVIRYDGISLPAPSAAINHIATWLQRFLILSGVILLVFLVTIFRKKQKT